LPGDGFFLDMPVRVNDTRWFHYGSLYHSSSYCSFSLASTVGGPPESRGIS
jgi:hypothetical protein